MTVLTRRRAAFRTGEIVELHPDSNPGVSSWELTDKAVVLTSVPSNDAPHLDIVSVVWDSKRQSLRGAQLDRPLSAYAVSLVSTKLRRPRTQGDL